MTKQTMQTITGSCIDRDAAVHTFIFDICADGDCNLYLDGSRSAEADSLETLQAMDSATPDGGEFPAWVGAARGW